MAAFNVGALVTHKSGDIKGVIDGVTEQDNRPTWYRVEWDDGTFKSHAEHELRAATVDGPQLYKRMD
ncbi:hypothetical protein DNK77_25650 [Enterobacter cloacae complex sp.]|nr:hypothetical protein [Enterococcus faecalis]PYZ35359.1 hypothetical protein DNK77_25650 [Enterobacter cloacae complex sp.]